MEGPSPANPQPPDTTSSGSSADGLRNQALQALKTILDRHDAELRQLINPHAGQQGSQQTNPAPAPPPKAVRPVCPGNGSCIGQVEQCEWGRLPWMDCPHNCQAVSCVDALKYPDVCWLRGRSPQDLRLKDGRCPECAAAHALFRKNAVKDYRGCFMCHAPCARSREHSALLELQARSLPEEVPAPTVECNLAVTAPLLAAQPTKVVLSAKCQTSQTGRSLCYPCFRRMCMLLDPRPMYP